MPDIPTEQTPVKPEYTLHTKEQWMELTLDQKQEAIHTALLVLLSLKNKTHSHFNDPEQKKTIPGRKGQLKQFLQNTHLWETELENLSKPNEPQP